MKIEIVGFVSLLPAEKAAVTTALHQIGFRVFKEGVANVRPLKNPELESLRTAIEHAITDCTVSFVVDGENVNYTVGGNYLGL